MKNINILPLSFCNAMYILTLHFGNPGLNQCFRNGHGLPKSNGDPQLFSHFIAIRDHKVH